MSTCKKCDGTGECCPERLCPGTECLDHCAICNGTGETEIKMSIESQAMEHLGIAIANLRAAASVLMQDHENNAKEIADAVNTAESMDSLMKAVGFNLAQKR